MTKNWYHLFGASQYPFLNMSSYSILLQEQGEEKKQQIKWRVEKNI